MKLLMITRKVDINDSRMGFFYQWVRAIGEKVEKLYVITWQKSDRGELPANIEIINLPQNKLLKIISLRFNTLRLLPKIDGIFCHMNPEYTILIAPLPKIFGKKVVSWYTHSAVSFRSRLMEKLTDRILTASKESFLLPSKKVLVTGHGIDTKNFFPIDSAEPLKDNFDLLSVGRISPTKDYESMIKAVNILSDQNIKNVRLKIIGEPALPEQQVYLDSLKQMVKVMKLENQVEFLGSVQNISLRKYFLDADAVINLSGTGSLDKAVLEAMACGRLVLTSNIAFKLILPTELMVEQNQPKALAERIEFLINLSGEKKRQWQNQLRQEVVNNHNLDNLIKKIIEQFS